MVQYVFRQVLQLFGTIATGLAGMGAVATAAGFLAERARWGILGLTAAPTDLNEYLFTGARFLAFLPGNVLTTTLLAITASWRLFLVVVVVAAVVWTLRRAHRSRRGASGSAAHEHAGGDWAGRLRPWGLVVLALVQLAGAYFLSRAGSLENVLFADRTALIGVTCGDGLTLEAQVLLGCDTQLVEHMGRAFLIVLASAGALWLLIPATPFPGDQVGRRRRDAPVILLGVNLALFTLQVILLPINHGALFMKNDFSVVEVTFAPTEALPDAWPVAGRVSLLHRQGNELYLYAASARRVWVVPRGEIESLTYLGICDIFRPLDECRIGRAPRSMTEEAP